MVSDRIQFKVISNNSIDNLNSDKIVESCAIEIMINNTKLIICGMYRTPSKKADMFLANLDKLLSLFLLRKNKNICVGGDFNIDVLTLDYLLCQKKIILKNWKQLNILLK